MLAFRIAIVDVQKQCFISFLDEHTYSGVEAYGKIRNLNPIGPGMTAIPIPEFNPTLCDLETETIDEPEPFITGKFKFPF